jgi:hypothetical protein
VAAAQKAVLATMAAGRFKSAERVTLDEVTPIKAALAEM